MGTFFLTRKCRGDLFSAKGFKYYRCFYDGRIFKADGTSPPKVCKCCSREVLLENDYGGVEIVTHPQNPELLCILLPRAWDNLLTILGEEN